MTEYVNPDNTTTPNLDDWHDAWKQDVERIGEWSGMDCIPHRHGGIALIGQHYRRQLDLPPWFTAMLLRLLADRERLTDMLADAQRTAQVIMENGGPHEDCAECQITEWLARIANEEV